MGLRFERKKPRNLLLSLIYRTQKLLPLSTEKKFRLFLDLEWIFDRLAHETSFKYFNTLNHPLRIQTRKFLLSRIQPDHIILDLGCHHGDISYYIAEKAGEVIGVDHNPDAIATANKKYQRKNLTFIQGDAFEYLSGNSKKFDVLILSHILEHLDEPEAFLKKFKVFFKNIFIEVPDFDRYYLNHYRKELGVKLSYSDDDHISEFDRDDLFSLLQNCGIEVIQSEFRHGVQRYWCKA